MADSKDKKPGLEVPAPKRRGRPPGKASKPASTVAASAIPAVAKVAEPSAPVRATPARAEAVKAATSPIRGRREAGPVIAKAAVAAETPSPVVPVASEPQRAEIKPSPVVADPVGARATAPAKQPPETKMTDPETILKSATATAEATSAKVTAMFNDLNDRSKSALTKGSKLIEDYADLTKGNLEAVGASTRAAAKGAETIAQNIAEYSRKNFEEATKALKGLTAVKSPTEAFQLQSEFAKNAFESMIAEASRASETVVKIWGDVLEPLSSRAAVATDKVRSAIK